MSVAVIAGSLLAMGTQAAALDKFMVEKTAVVSTIASGGTATFQIVATAINTGTGNIVENFTLTDNLPTGTWTLGGPNQSFCGISSNVLTCNFGDVAEGTSFTITVSRTTTDADCAAPITNTVTVSSPDISFESGSEQLDNTSTASITVTCAPPPSHNIVPTGTTCEQFRDGTATDLNAIFYKVKDGSINSVAPGIGFYFVRWTSTGAALVITQSDNGPTPPFGVSNVQVYRTSDCQRVDKTEGLTITVGATTVTIAGTTSGHDYIARLGFDPNTVKGSADPGGTVVYTYTAGVANSTDSISLSPQP